MTKTPLFIRSSSFIVTSHKNDLCICILVFVLLSALAFNMVSAKAAVYYIPVPCNTIQEAVNAADPGDAIHVKAGLYRENVVVNKTLRIFGENELTTVIQANSTESDVVQIVADNVFISGFTVKDGNNGVKVHASNCTISGNVVFNNSIGITLERSVNCLVNDNTVIRNVRAGIGCGVFLLDRSSNNMIRDNRVLDNGEGIYLLNSDYNFVVGNLLFNNTRTGVCLMKGAKSCDYNTIRDNIIEEGACYGIDLWSVNYNAVFNNTLKSNGENLHVDYSSNNSIYHNNFVKGFKQVYSYGSTNMWDDGFEGNYWSDYNWTEFDEYGIGTLPYNISLGSPVNKDFYPLRSFYIRGDANHDGIINMTDADLLRSSWLALLGEAGYSAYVDFNRDGLVSIKDATVIGVCWMRTV